MFSVFSSQEFCFLYLEFRLHFLWPSFSTTDVEVNFKSGLGTAVIYSIFRVSVSKMLVVGRPRCRWSGEVRCWLTAPLLVVVRAQE